jgi:hypothetical protein
MKAATIAPITKGPIKVLPAPISSDEPHSAKKGSQTVHPINAAIAQISAHMEGLGRWNREKVSSHMLLHSCVDDATKARLEQLLSRSSFLGGRFSTF